MQKSSFVLTGAMLFLWQSLAIADELVDAGMTEVSVGIELFRWQEFDSAGTRLLTEQGPRAYFRFSHNNESRLTDGIVYSVSGSLYGGDVEYDGQSQSTIPNTPKENTGYFSAANVDYAGVSGEVWGGYRLANFMKGRSIDLLAGVGIDSWTREIGSGINSQGATVQGVVEDYKVAYTRFGLGAENRDPIWRSLWRAGIKYPFFTKETLDILSVGLEPQGEASAFFMYRFQLSDNGKLNSGTFVYFVYDSYRFSKSPIVASGNLLVYQPRSNMDVVSLSIGRAF